METSSFSAFNFSSTKSNSSSVNCPGFMSHWSLIFFFDRFINDFRGVSKKIRRMFFPLLKSFFLLGSFYFCSQGVLLSDHFIYCFVIFFKVSYFTDLALNIFLFFLVCVISI